MKSAQKKERPFFIFETANYIFDVEDGGNVIIVKI